MDKLLDPSVVKLYKAAKSASRAIKDVIDMLERCDVGHETAHDVAFANGDYYCDPALHQLHLQLWRKRWDLGQVNARLEGCMETIEEELQDAYPDLGP